MLVTPLTQYGHMTISGQWSCPNIAMWPYLDSDISHHPRPFVMFRLRGGEFFLPQLIGPVGATIDLTFPHGHTWSMALSK